MTYDEWWEHYRPIPNEVIGPENAPFDGCMFETFGPEMKEVCLTSHGRIWTLLDVGGKTYISNGLYFVNRIGYFICAVPHEGGDIEILVGGACGNDDIEDEENT